MKLLLTSAAIAASLLAAAPAFAQTDPNAPGVAGASGIAAANGVPDSTASVATASDGTTYTTASGNPAPSDSSAYPSGDNSVQSNGGTDKGAGASAPAKSAN